jgi:hypothetical protein
MDINRGTLCILLILTCGLLEDPARADENSKIKVVTDWSEDEQPIRVDCHNLGMTGDGIGGAHLSCSDRLSLYATFSCFPMKKEVVETTCPEWEGLEADIDWERVSELIDIRDAERAAEEARKKHEFDQLFSGDEERQESDR